MACVVKSFYLKERITRDQLLFVLLKKRAMCCYIFYVWSEHAKEVCLNTAAHNSLFVVSEFLLRSLLTAVRFSPEPRLDRRFSTTRGANVEIAGD